MSDRDAEYTPPKWEYQMIQQKRGLPQMELNELGGEGWEMCGYHVHTEVDGAWLFQYYFKRKL